MKIFYASSSTDQRDQKHMGESFDELLKRYDFRCGCGKDDCPLIVMGEGSAFFNEIVLTPTHPKLFEMIPRDNPDTPNELVYACLMSYSAKGGIKFDIANTGDKFRIETFNDID